MWSMATTPCSVECSFGSSLGEMNLRNLEMIIIIAYFFYACQGTTIIHWSIIRMIGSFLTELGFTSYWLSKAAHCIFFRIKYVA